MPKECLLACVPVLAHWQLAFPVTAGAPLGMGESVLLMTKLDLVSSSAASQSQMERK